MKSNKKKILILSCQGGGGHMSAATAIQSYLSKHNYEIIILDIMGETFAYLDPVYYITGTYFTGQDIYNFLLRHNKKRLINFFFHFGCFLINLKKNSLLKGFQSLFKLYQPDLVISVIPLFNEFLTKITIANNIPTVIIPTDFDVHTFLKNVSIDKKDFVTIALGIDYPEINSKLCTSSINQAAIEFIGFPIRESFFEQKDHIFIKKSFNIPVNIPIILLVMGATGSTATLIYIEQLSKISIQFHLIACIGRNNQLAQKIKALTIPPHISLTIIDSTYDISNVMAIADICITKPGSVTFAETLYMNIPILLDNTTPALIWEHLNLELLEKYNLGTIIKNYSQIKPVVSNYLQNSSLRTTIKNNIIGLNKKHFGTELIILLDRIFAHVKGIKDDEFC